MEAVASLITRVFRIENKRGEGIYRTDEDHDIYNCRSYSLNGDNDNHPSPESDSVLMANLRNAGYVKGINGLFHVEHFSFGFVNVEQLRKWFYDDTWLEWMDDNGFHLSIYYVHSDAVMIGNTQCMFVKSNNYDMHSFREYLNLDSCKEFQKAS